MEEQQTAKRPLELDENHGSTHKIKKYDWKYVLIMANTAWSGKSGYIGLEVEMSTDKKSYAATSTWIRLVNLNNGPLPTNPNVEIGKIFKIPFQGNANYPNQPENWKVKEDAEWEFVLSTDLVDDGETDQVIRGSLKCEDDSGDLWYDKDSGHTTNERIQKKKVIKRSDDEDFRSCQLIHVDKLVITLFHRTYGESKGKQFRRGRFTFNSKTFELDINERDETMLAKIAVKYEDAFPYEAASIQREIGPCYILVSLLANDEGRKIHPPNDAPDKEFYYKTISHIYCQSLKCEIRDVSTDDEQIPTCQELLEISQKVPHAIKDWEQGFLEDNSCLRSNDYGSMTPRQQQFFREIYDKIKRNYPLGNYSQQY